MTKLTIAWSVVFGACLLLGPACTEASLIGIAGIAFFAVSPICVPRGIRLIRKAANPAAKSVGRTTLIFGIVGSVLAVVLVLTSAWLHRAHWDSALRASCQNNLKQIGLALDMYAAASPEGLYPALSSEPGMLMFPAHILTDALDVCVLSCPANADKIPEDGSPDDSSYFYIGYAVTNDEEMRLFAKAYTKRMADGLPLDVDLSVLPEESNPLRDSIPRLRRGVERVFLGESEDDEALARQRSQIPVIIERVGHHKKPGANVVFLDNHVEFIPYPGKWPMTETTLALLQEIDDMGRTSQ